MKILRYETADGRIEYGQHHADGSITRLRGSPLQGPVESTDEPANVAMLLAPIEVSGIWCIGLNYRQHAAETNAPLPQWPVLFMKGLNSIQNPGHAIVLPRWLRSDKVDYEGELAVVISRACRNVRREEALEYVLGYTCANDVSARDWQKTGGGSQWCRGKSFDTFCPLGPCIVTTDDIPNPNALAIRTIIGGEVLQKSSTADMIFDVPSLIEFLSGSTTLLPGTVILTGTPHGVGVARTPPRFLEPGESVTVEIDGIGALTNPVVEERAEGGSSFHL